MRFGNVIEGVQAQSAGQAVMTGDDGKVPAELVTGGGVYYDNITFAEAYQHLSDAPAGSLVLIRLNGGAMPIEFIGNKQSPTMYYGIGVGEYNDNHDVSYIYTILTLLGSQIQFSGGNGIDRATISTGGALLYIL